MSVQYIGCDCHKFESKFPVPCPRLVQGEDDVLAWHAKRFGDKERVIMVAKDVLLNTMKGFDLHVVEKM